MQARSATALCALALAVVACTKFDADLGGASASSPHPTSVEPASGHAESSTPVTIHGDGFLLRTTQSAPGGTPTIEPPIDQQYHAWLDGVALEAVTWQDSNTLQATVPGGLSAGKKTLVVENAFGSRGQLGSAYEVLAGSALGATIRATPSIVNVGQAVTLTLTVTNAGSADLTGVTPVGPTISSTNGATAALSSGPTPATVAALAPGASRDFTWVYTPTAAGTLNLSSSATGTDSFSGSPITGAPATPAQVTVQSPAALTATISANPTIVGVGQAINVTLRVTNTGSATANISAVTPSPAAICGTVSPVDIPGGEFRDFTWSCTPTAAGSLTLSGTATGTDANSASALSAIPATPATVAVQAPAVLTATITSSRTIVSGTQAVTLTFRLTNGATSAPANITAVTPSWIPVANATCGPVNQALPRTIPTNDFRDFTWTCTPSGTAGNLTLSGTATGTDANSGAPLNATPATPAVVTVQSPAALTATAAITGNPNVTVSVGQQITLRLTVSNSAPAAGGASATVSSVPLNSAAAGICGAVGQALPQTIAGGASTTFTWNCIPTAAASNLVLGATASGADANSGTPLSASASTTVTVQTAAVVTATGITAPAAVNTGQAFALTLTLSKAGAASANVTGVTLNGAAAAICTGQNPATPVNNVGPTQTFTWTCTATLAGSLSLDATATWVDVNVGTTQTTTPAIAAAVTVQTAAVVTATGITAPATVNTGQAFTLTLTLSKTGTASANVTGITLNVAAAGICTGQTPATPVNNVGATQTFTWTCTATSAGSLSLNATASWVDVNVGTTQATTPATAATVTVQSGAAITATIVITGNLTTVSTGQAIGLTFTVTNTGNASAVISSVTPSTSGVAASCGSVSPALPQTILGGQNRAFTWTCTPSAAGSLTLSGAAIGTDGTSGNPLIPATASTGALTVQTAASLSVTTFAASPITVNTNQATTVTLTLNNTGQATANVSGVNRNIVPGGNSSCTPVSPVLPQIILGGQNGSFNWTCSWTQARPTYTLNATVTATDANSGVNAISTQPTGTAVTVQNPAALTATSIGATTANGGENITLTLRVTNGGGATANNVTPGTPTQGGTGAASIATAPAAFSIPEGQFHDFIWTYTATAAGNITFTVGASGTDANSGATVTAAAVTSTAVTIVPPAVLSATSITATPGTGSVTLTLEVTNSGGTTANNVGPSGTPTVTGTGTVTLATPPTPFDLGAGAANTLTWIYTVDTAGDLTFSAAASGTDANSSATVTSNTLTTSTVTITTLAASQALVATANTSEAILVASDPFGDGTPAAFVNAYQGGAWVGPSRDGQKLVRLDPLGSAAPTSAGLALGVEAGLTPAANAAWLANPPANTLGAPGCTAGTVGCGPDDEAGGGLILAGTMGGVEWLGLSGVSAAGSRYLYATSSSASPLDVAWVDLLAAFQAASATSWSPALSAALFVPDAADRLYLGYAGLGSGHGPLLFALLAPPASPGFDAIAGADVLDLAAIAMPGVASTAGVPGITALMSLQGILYVAHDGGLVRATTATPSSAATAPGDWARATPSAPAWGAKTSVPLPGTAGLSPRDRAVPALAAFGTCAEGPCIFAARNVRGSPTQPAVVPQLWRCSPTAGLAQCAPGDWSLAAPNASGDMLLTQLGDETNGAATVLVATAKGLYLGFDNGSTGVQLYRAATAPQSIADFRGRSGCAAGTAGCQGLGGNGFGDPTVTRVFDAKALTFGGTTSLWVTAGDGISPVRVYRIDPPEDTATASVTAEPGAATSPVPAAVERTARGGGCSTGGTSAVTLLAALGLALMRRRSGGRGSR